jgi:hypothetical protein
MSDMFDMRCRDTGIEHRLTKIRRAWTLGQVERLNRTLKEPPSNYQYDRYM